MTIETVPPAELEMWASVDDWIEVCGANKVPVERGVAAVVDGRPIAIFRISSDDGDKFFAVDHIDPRTNTPTIARGIVGSANDEPIVISPLLKDRFSLITGSCLNEPELSISVLDVKLTDNLVFVRTNVTSGKQA